MTTASYEFRIIYSNGEKILLNECKEKKKKSNSNFVFGYQISDITVVFLAENMKPKLL